MKNFRRLLSYLRPYKRRFALAALLSLVGIAGELLTPRLFGWTVDRGVTSGNLRTVAFYATLLILAMVIRSIFSYLQWNVQHQVGQDVIRDLRDQLYAKLQQLPPSFYRAMPTGQIMSRMTGDVEAVLEYLGWGLLVQFMALVSFFGTMIMLLTIERTLTLVLMIPLVPMVLVVIFLDRHVGPAWEKVREQMGELTTVLQENISGVRVVKAFAAEGGEISKFSGENNEQKELNLVRAEIETRTFPLLDLLIGIAFVLLAWFGAQRVLSGDMTLGTFFAYQWYLWGIIWPVRFMGWMISMMREALSGAPRLFEVLDAPPAIADRPDAMPLGRVAGDIRFEGVSFAFPDEPDRPVLEGLELHIRPGEIVAVLGGTGSGKSSLMALVPRFFDVTAGRVTVDGHDVRDVTLDSLRQQIAFVPQEAFLFSATVRENITYGHAEATDEQVIAAATLAQAHDFILELADGYDSVVGERGIGLSGGQKQRLALARALLMEPPILLLDEATSAVDTETEHEIQQALEQIMEGRTSLIIAQRLSTIKHAHRIVYLRDGRVVEEGTHAELLALGGEYARLYDLQYREEDNAEAEVFGEWSMEHEVMAVPS